MHNLSIFMVPNAADLLAVCYHPWHLPTYIRWSLAAIKIKCMHLIYVSLPHSFRKYQIKPCRYLNQIHFSVLFRSVSSWSCNYIYIPTGITYSDWSGDCPYRLESLTQIKSAPFYWFYSDRYPDSPVIALISLNHTNKISISFILFIHWTLILPVFSSLQNENFHQNPWRRCRSFLH